ncbi:MAG: gas vesicle protein [Actinomycetota bacterium]|nr:gas vesicle protein [Actinomycetota bacterium]
MSSGQGTLNRAPRPSSLADVLDLILDKGLVIDAYVRVSVAGIELLTIDARIVIASVDTYLHFAEAVNRLDLAETETKGISGLFGNDSGDDSSSDDGADEKADSAGHARSALHGGEEQPRGGGDGRRKRQPATIARRLADRGKWEDE